ncbi:Protein MMS22-like [Mactra antiquata]
MNMDRGESLTPPVSPVGLSIEDLIESEQIEVEEDNIERETICFTCGEDSYFNGGYMRGLLKSNHHDNIFNQKEISLFSHTWPSMNCENFDRLFLMMRQQIGDLQSTAVISRLSFINDSDSLQGNTVRQQVCSFLQYVLDYVQSQHISKNDIQSIVNGLQTVLLHIGRLSELPNHILHTTSIGSKLTISEHCLHLHLDVYWRILSIIHTIEVKYSDCGINVGGYFNSDDQYDNTSLFNNILHSILWDLTCLANVRYISKVNRDDPMETTMFGCSCIKEIWTLILVITDWRSNTHIGESFWISFHHILKSCLDLDITDTSMLMEVDDCRSVKNPPDTFKTDDVVGLNLWMLYHLSSLYAQTLLSTVVNNWSSKPVSNYHDLEAVIKKLFATPNVSESTLKKHLRTCLYLTNDWEPNTRLLITLWDFYYKRLNQNDSYQSSRSTLDGLACMDTSVVSMYDRCLQWTQAHLDSLKKDTSYQIFIRILCQHLGKLYRNGSTQEWKQVKGRIYSKFHARRLQELMECGLYNLTVLFVSLGMTADLEDVSSKLCDFYDMLDINAITYAKRCVIWRGAFTLMLVYVSQDMDISFLADKMSSTFEHVVNDYETAGIDNKHNLWKLILIYLEGLEEVVESSKNILQSQYKLLGPALHKLLTICSEQELRTTLSTLHAVITKYREIITKTPRNSLDVKSSLQYAEFSCVLWRNVYSFVVDHSQTLTPPPILADMAATFCLLALNNFEDEGNDRKKSFLEIFKYFSVSEKVNTSISCNFLSLLLPCDEVLTRLQTELSNYEQFIINIWFRCCLILPHGSTVLQNITRCVKKLPQFNDIMMQSELVWDDIDEVPVLFLKGLEKIHKKIENWQEKMKFQQQIIPYFTDVLKYINPVIKSWSPVDVVNKIYLMTGFLIKYCAKLIYVRVGTIVAMVVADKLIHISVDTIVAMVTVDAIVAMVVADKLI